jgi:hypothetical protein
VRLFRKNALAATASFKTEFIKVAVGATLAFVGYTRSGSYDQLLTMLQNKFIIYFI